MIAPHLAIPDSVAKWAYPLLLASALRRRPSRHKPSEPNCRVRRHCRPPKDEYGLARSRNVRQENHCMSAMPHATARALSDLPESLAGISYERLPAELELPPPV